MRVRLALGLIAGCMASCSSTGANTTPSVIQDAAPEATPDAVSELDAAADSPPAPEASIDVEVESDAHETGGGCQPPPALESLGGCWWRSMLPGAEQIGGTGPNDVWAGGYSLHHFDGKSWSQLENGMVGYSIRSILSLGSGQAYVAMENRVDNKPGELLRFDGFQWTRVLESKTLMRAVWGTSPCNLYVGSDEFLHWDGSSWAALPDGPSGRVDTMQGNAADDVYVAAWDNGGAAGVSTMFHFDGTAWSKLFTTQPGQVVGAFWASSTSDVWFFEPGTSSGDGNFWHYDGAGLEMNALTLYSVESMTGKGPSEIYALSDGTLMHYDGTGWVADTAQQGDRISALGSVPGVGVLAGSQQGLFNYEAGKLTPLVGFPQCGDKVWASSAADMFTVHSLQAPDLIPGYASVSHFDGKQWSWMPSTQEPLNDVSGSAGDDVWAVGHHTVVHYDGSKWSLVDVGELGDWWSVWATSKDDVYLTDTTGALMHFDGVNWAQVTLPSSTDVTDVWAASKTDVFGVGSSGIVHFDGTSWVKQSSGLMRRVWGPAGNDVYASTLDAELYHFDGLSWKALNVKLSSGTAYDVWGTAPDDIYFVGVGGYHYDGANWTYSDGLGASDVWKNSADDVYLMGSCKHYSCQ